MRLEVAGWLGDNEILKWHLREAGAILEKLKPETGTGREWQIELANPSRLGRDGGFPVIVTAWRLGCRFAASSFMRSRIAGRGNRATALGARLCVH